MNFTTERNLLDQVFSTKIKFSSFGGAGITPEDEKALVEDFGAPVIDIGSAVFTGKYKYDADTKTVVEDDTNGDVVTFILNSLKLPVTTGFEASYSASSKRITAEDLAGKTTLNKPHLVAEARCLLFEKTVRAKLAAAVAELKNNMSKFDKVVVEPFTV